VELKTLDAKKLSNAFLSGAKSLEAKKDEINELNVFPVPDGDTGTNMTMTVMSAAKAVHELGDDADIKSVCKAMSSGSLRGARGNSGVILSQLLRGFTKIVKAEEVIDVDVLARGCERATETAYKAVMKPKEGTILTVARGISDRAILLAEETDDIVYFLEELVEEGDRVLQKTPDLLPVLKQAGVVDSGGAGLLEILRGAYKYISGEKVDLSLVSDEEKESTSDERIFNYHLSFVLVPAKHTTDDRKDGFASYLSLSGGNVIIDKKDLYISASLDTDNPGDIFRKALELGSLHEIELKNNGDKEGFIRPESTSDSDSSYATTTKADSTEKKAMGFVAVMAGEGMSRIFSDLGCDVCITGGQTMNPSTDDILNAVEKINCDNVFVLPNNKNIILAANQAALLCKDKNIIVIPTKSVPQGITALINFLPDSSVEENKEIMENEIQNVKTGEITYAVRNTMIDDKEITAGDFMGIGDSGLLSVGRNRNDVFIEMLENMVDDMSSIITIYYGEDVTEGEAEETKNFIQAKFPNLEIDLENGGQPVYYYVTSVE